ncbi:mob1/phocein family protein [Hirsutella rhossiliensis]|uniref:Mob1/phocein family domain-containing protein n=1 Tax=Hirsutella rhossiliensis TaxID=111463 RepID=A0A9P8SK96_9HYPO|nr:mob1/phocein family domain-containing protein [Hirsutella rhossiliensis]KAH0965701.1 mob1/phocein family domain-containing protein [Hirsutella rhossiliensis]
MALASSSPRLPSPPPPAEIQLGPKSPSGGVTVSPHDTQMEQTLLDANSRRRVHPGTRAADMAAGPPLIPLNELDSAFQLQEHLAALHYHHTASSTQALTRTTALHLAQPPPGIDRTLWLYELCRFLISQCNSLIVGFLFDSPPCSAGTCPEMRASEWQFLCAVHEQPKSCCAIDYCCHTLDWAANVVSDQKIFPSRFVVLSDTHNKNLGIKNLVNVFRRLHRIFAHAWFQHRSVFWTVEGQTGLYVFFKTVCDLYDLLPAENYKLPPEAEGLDDAVSEPEAEKPPPTILKPTMQQRGGFGDDDGLHSVGRTNTRRHIRSSPSTGSAVTTVMETDEEDADTASGKLLNVHASDPPQPPAEEHEPEAAEIPVIVEQAAPVRAPSQTASAPREVQESTDPAEPVDAGQTDTTAQPEHDEHNDDAAHPDGSADSSAEIAGKNEAPAQPAEAPEEEAPPDPEPAAEVAEEPTLEKLEEPGTDLTEETAAKAETAEVSATEESKADK